MSNNEKLINFIEQNIFIDINPTDDWDDWEYQILAKDCMAPFFVAHSDYGFSSYEDALNDAVKHIETNLI
jgi:hypothetical protein